MSLIVTDIRKSSIAVPLKFLTVATGQCESDFEKRSVNYWSSLWVDKKSTKLASRV